MVLIVVCFPIISQLDQQLERDGERVDPFLERRRKRGEREKKERKKEEKK